MTKEELEQYRSIVAEIDEIRDRLNQNTVHGTIKILICSISGLMPIMRGLWNAEQRTKTDIL